MFNAVPKNLDAKETTTNHNPVDAREQGSATLEDQRQRSLRPPVSKHGANSTDQIDKPFFKRDHKQQHLTHMPNGNPKLLDPNKIPSWLKPS